LKLAGDLFIGDRPKAKWGVARVCHEGWQKIFRWLFSF